MVYSRFTSQSQLFLIRAANSQGLQNQHPALNPSHCHCTAERTLSETAMTGQQTMHVDHPSAGMREDRLDHSVSHPSAQEPLQFPRLSLGTHPLCTTSPPQLTPLRGRRNCPGRRGFLWSRRGSIHRSGISGREEYSGVQSTRRHSPTRVRPPRNARGRGARGCTTGAVSASVLGAFWGQVPPGRAAPPETSLLHRNCVCDGGGAGLATWRRRLGMPLARREGHDVTAGCVGMGIGKIARGYLWHNLHYASI